jgi:hypothetical protein
MKLTKEEDARMVESRDKILKAMLLSLGTYIEQEGKKKDEWRDKSYGELYAHLKHEIAEIQRSKEKTVQLHNAMDACTLAAIMVAHLIDLP